MTMPGCVGRPVASSQRGIALLAVLWITAALAVLVAGMVHQIRADTQIAGMQLQQAQMSSVFEGALRMAERDIPALSESRIRTATIRYRIADREIQVRAEPLNGFISVTSAPESLLVDLFHHGAGLSLEEATQLARSMVAYREQTPDAFISRRQWLQVSGMTPSTYAKIKDLAVAQRVSGGRVNPGAAPEEVLRVLARGDDAAVRQFLDSRDLSPDEWRLDGLASRHVLPGRSRGWVLHLEHQNDDHIWRLSALYAPGMVFGQRDWKYLEPLHKLRLADKGQDRP